MIFKMMYKLKLGKMENYKINIKSYELCKKITCTIQLNGCLSIEYQYS